MRFFLAKVSRPDDIWAKNCFENCFEITVNFFMRGAGVLEFDG